MNNQAPDSWDEAVQRYNDTSPSWDLAAQKYEQKPTSTNQPAPARHGMQAAIGLGQGATYFKNPTAILADMAEPGFTENIRQEFAESELEEQGMKKIAQQFREGKPPRQEAAPDTREAAEARAMDYFKERVNREGVNEARKDLLGEESLIAGIIGLPFRVFGIQTEPKNYEESITRNAAALVGSLSSATASLRQGARGGIVLPPLSAKDQAAALAKLTPLAFTSAVAGQVGETLYGVPGRIGAELLFGATIMGGQKVYQKAKEIPLSRLNLAEQAMSKERHAEVVPYIKIAEKYKIPISIGTISDNQYVRSVEEKIAKNNLTGPNAQKFRQEAAEEWGNLYKSFLKNSAGAAEYESAGAIAQKLKESVLNPAEEAIFTNARKYYAASEEGFRGARPLPPSSVKKIEDSLNTVVGKVSQSLIPTSTEKSVAGVAKEGIEKLSMSPKQAGKQELQGVKFPVGQQQAALEKQSQTHIGGVVKEAIESQPGQKLTGNIGQKRQMRAQAAIKAEEKRRGAGQKITEEEKAKSQEALQKLFGADAENMVVTDSGDIRFVQNITPGKIVATVRSLNDKIQWEDRNVVNLFQGPRKVLRAELNANYKDTHPEALNNYYKGNAEYSKGAKLFTGDRAKYSKWRIGSDASPESLANELNSVQKFKQFESDFGGTKQGKELIGYVKRKKIDDQLKQVFDRMSERYIPGAVSSKVNLEKDNQFLKYLAGDDWKKFEEIAKLDKFIHNNATKIYTAGMSTADQNTFLEALKLPLMIMHPASAGTIAGIQSAYKLANKTFLNEMKTLYSSPELMKESIRIAEHAPAWKQKPDYWNATIQQFNQNLKLKTAESETLNKAM